MNRFPLFAGCLAIVCFAIALALPDQAQTPATISVRPYVVTNAAAFPSLPLPPNSLIFRNGLYQTQGIDYDTINGTAFTFRADVLMNGDTISVVTLP